MITNNLFATRMIETKLHFSFAQSVVIYHIKKKMDIYICVTEISSKICLKQKNGVGSVNRNCNCNG